MKKIILAIVAVITMSATVMAQEENKPMRDHQRPDMKERVKQRTAETVKAYGLNGCKVVGIEPPVCRQDQAYGWPEPSRRPQRTSSPHEP